MEKIVEIAIRCKVAGLKGLSVEERQELCDFFCKEIRKGSFRIPDDDSENIIRQFCEYIEAETANEEMLVVIDFHQVLKNAAENLSKESVPISALILYASLVEHWLSMLIVVALTKRGDNRLSIDKFLKAYWTISEKLACLEDKLGFSALQPDTRKFIDDLMRLRNDHVHYKWNALSKEENLALRKDIRDVVSSAPKHISTLKTYEFVNLDAVYIPALKKIFPGLNYRF